MFSFRPSTLPMLTRDTTMTNEFIQSKIDFVDYVFEKKHFNKEEFKIIQLFNQEVPVYNEPESMLFLELNQYMIQGYFYYWMASFYTDKTQEGWKTHVSIVSDEEYSFLLHYILPVLRENNINHKVVRPDEVKFFNEHLTQKGKILTIYPNSLDFLKLFPSHCREFLLEDNGLRIPTDLHLGGKVYTRYTGYSRDYVIHPETKTPFYMERKEGFYKPDWIKEPLDLQSIFQKEEMKHV